MAATDTMGQLREAGFTKEEVEAWAIQHHKRLTDAGFTPEEVEADFGRHPFNDAPLHDHFTRNLNEWAAEKPRHATDMMGAFKAGWEGSSAGLLLHGRPTHTLDADAGRPERLASSVGGVVGDIPAIAAGFLAGGGPLSPLTGTAGAMALPQGLRAILIDKLDRGEVASKEDFLSRASHALTEAVKGWVTGFATGAAGLGARLAAPSILSPAAREALVVAAEVPTMVAVGKGLEGEIPSVDDFIDASILLGGMKFTMKGVQVATGKVGQIYAATGITPKQVVADVESVPSVAADVRSTNITVPRIYGGGVPPKPPPAPPVVPPPATPVSAAEAKILSKVEFEDPAKPSTSFADVRTALLDNLDPIKRAVASIEQGVDPAPDNAYMLKRLTRGIHGQMQEVIRSGMYDFNTLETVTRGYEEILKPVESNLHQFSAYIISRHALELHARGIQTAFDIDAARAVVQEGAAQFEAVAQERLTFKDAQLKFLVDGGIIKRSEAAAMKSANRAYVPFYRFFGEEAPGSVKGSAADLYNPIHRIAGSVEAIRDPIVSDFKDTERILTIVNENAARRAFVALGPKYATKIQKDTERIHLTEHETEQITGETTEVGEKAARIYRAKQVPLRTDEIAVFIDGQRSVYRVDPKVAEAFEDLDRTSTTVLARMVLHAPASLLRAGVTLSPAYMVKNVIRDALSSFVYSGGTPLKTISGAYSLATKDEAFHRWMKGGGANATWVAIDRDFVHGQFIDANLEAGLLKKAWNAVTSPLELLRLTSEFLENSTRLGTVKSELQVAKTKAQIQALSFMAREATVDFAVHGRDTQNWSRSAAFLNPGVQGIDRFMRALHEDPVGVTTRALAFVTIPSLLLWWANRDDEEIQQLSTIEKALFAPVRVNGAIFRIPMHPEFGVLFSYAPQALLDRYYTENPDALKHLDDAMLQLVTTNILPTVAVPMVEQESNKNLLSGRPIIPSYAEKFLPEYQHTDSTTETTKAIARYIAAVPGVREASLKGTPIVGGIATALTTPLLIDNYLRSWGGGLGVLLRDLADAGLRRQGLLPDPPTPASRMTELPLLKAFFSRHSGIDQAVEDFYQASRVGRRYWDTAIMLAKTGDPGAAAFIDRHLADIGHVDELEKSMNEMWGVIRLMVKNPSIPPDEQREASERLAYAIGQMAVAGNTTLKLMRESLEASKKVSSIAPAPPATEDAAPLPPMDEPEEVSSSQRDEPLSGGAVWPLDGTTVRRYGPQRHAHWPTTVTYHDIQIHATKDHAVRAALPGKVVYADVLKRIGPTIIVEHADGVSTSYSSETLTLPQVGRMVRSGDVLGSINRGGNDILSFQMHKGKDRVDPMSYLMPESAPPVRGASIQKAGPSLASVAAERPYHLPQGVANGPHINE